MKTTAKVPGAFFQFLATLIANLMAITDGMSMGWTSPMIPYFLSEKSHILMTRNQAEWLESWILIGAAAALPFTAICVEKMGRKKSLLLATFILILCWIVIAVAPSVAYISASRFFNGFGLNMAFVAAPMYVGEIAHKSIRGFMSSIVFIMTLVGILVIYCVGPFVPYYLPSVIAVSLLVIKFVAFSFMPESPYYLISRSKYEEGKRSLQRFRGKEDIEEEFKEIKESADSDREMDGRLMDIVLVKNYRKAMLIMVVLNSGQLLASFEVILMNLHEILNSAGSIYIDSSYAAIFYSIAMLIASVISSLLMDKFGRKKLLIISSILTGISLLVLAAYFHLKQLGYDTRTFSWIPIASVMVYAGVFKFGLGMVPIVMTAELFASKMKAIGMTLADGIYLVASLVALQIFLTLRNLYGMHMPFYLFAVCTFLTCFFVVYFVPETKGKSLDEIQQILKGSDLVPSKELSPKASLNYRTVRQTERK